jgi:hypothetical protein
MKKIFERIHDTLGLAGSDQIEQDLGARQFQSVPARSRQSRISAKASLSLLLHS